MYGSQGQGQTGHLVEGALLIVRAIAIVDPLHKLKQTAQGSKRIAWLNAALGMYRQIAQLDC